LLRRGVEGDLDNNFWQKTEDLTVLGSHDFFGREMVIVGNTDYITEAVLAGRASRSRVEYFLDPARDYLVVGYAVSNFEGVKTEDVLFEYAEDARIGHSPTRITRTRFNAKTGDLESHSSIEIEEVAVNEPIDPREFEIEFAPGTKVNDKIRGIAYVVGEDGRTPLDATPDAAPDEIAEPFAPSDPPAPETDRQPPLPPAIQIAPRPIDPPSSRHGLGPARIALGAILLTIGLALAALHRSMGRKG
jgi:hypothetical protein